MKENVDLTEDLVFSRIPFRNTMLLRDLIYGRTYPWDYGRYIFQTIYDSLVLVGDKSSRKSLRNERNYRNHRIGCERCGTDIYGKPWNRVGCLCSKCDEELFADYMDDRYPWIFSLKVKKKLTL